MEGGGGADELAICPGNERKATFQRVLGVSGCELRREGIQPCCARCEARAGGLQQGALKGGELFLRRSTGGVQAAGGEVSACHIQPVARLLQPLARGALQLLLQHIELLHEGRQRLRRAGKLASGGRAQAQGGELQRAGEAAAQVEPGLGEPGIQRGGIRRGELNGGGGRGGAQVGHEVGNGEIRLMPHGGNHREGALRYGACHHLLIKAPEVFHGAAAARHNEVIHSWQTVCLGLCPQANGACNAVLRTPPLHLHGQQVGVHPRGAFFQSVAHVLNHRTRGRGDEPDRLRKGGQGALTGRAEEPLCLQLSLECFKALLQGAHAGLQHARDDELQRAAPLPHRGTPGEFHLQAFAQTHSAAVCLKAVENALKLARLVLEREINMTATRHFAGADFALHALLAHLDLHRAAEAGYKLGDGEGLHGKNGVRGGVWLPSCGRGVPLSRFLLRVLRAGVYVLTPSAAAPHSDQPSWGRSPWRS